MAGIQTPQESPDPHGERQGSQNDPCIDESRGVHGTRTRGRGLRDRNGRIGGRHAGGRLQPARAQAHAQLKGPAQTTHQDGQQGREGRGYDGRHLAVHQVRNRRLEKTQIE